ncbi:TonB-dependent receptor [Mucilaginibacter myungsuensis]|uniref:Carboxypeptidase-like regulatory domain-containing protein n=1 Tax=Mucilaginibacter myungsuensis TaxID=649104 RepID=A0A929KYM5_9SPHI|nr:TonB-dependent receptor [Mucilaginibacter myungsuensis]MBE9664091.1 carboxypeptidase-like regulatory domain-containing protein [Mucilaginibacter myungsuensis]MDN3601270.1 carboxypeptidase-like regulatory domain-containing protein [Mucilaginibacter myungsuensis]
MRIFLLLFFGLLISSAVSAQTGNSTPVSVNYTSAGIEAIVTDLESKTNYHFYYDKPVFDSLKVTLRIERQSFAAVLEQIFANTPYQFAIAGTDVFLTKGTALQTTLVPGIFEPVPADYIARKAAAATGTRKFATGNEVVPVAVIENKTYVVGTRTNTIGKGNATIAGYIKEAKNGEPIIGASIYVVDTKTSAATDRFGYYSLTLPKGQHTILIKAIGSNDTRRQFILYADGKLNIEMSERIEKLREVEISAEKVANVRSTQMGAIKMNIKTMKEIPTVFGETDVLRAVTLLPGVQTVGESTTGFNVRGGAVDQNLILLNGATVYNPAHFFGFFSAFNPDVVKDVELYKSTIPEKFGGRLSSVLDVADREGNKKKFTGTAGIGLLTSRASVEGPIGSSEKTSFIFGGRVTYSDWLIKSLPKLYNKSSASFHDLNLDISHKFNDKNDLYIYSYLSKDGFSLNDSSDYAYGNRNVAIKWKHNFNNKFYGVVSGGMDHYNYSIADKDNVVTAQRIKMSIDQSNFKTDFTYYVNTKHTVTFGTSAILYDLAPGSRSPSTSGSLIIPDAVPQQKGLEAAVYLGDKFDVTDKLSLSAGLRFSGFGSMGPAIVNNYIPGLPKSEATFTGTTVYDGGKFIKTYGGPEVRLSGRYTLGDNTSIKAGYNTMRQYIHLLTNTTAISPTDVYQLSDANIKPQYGDQVSLGLYRNLKANTVETSVEVYYKRLRDYLDYKDGATLFLNHNIERDIISTTGKAYGVEFLVRKTAGTLTGLASYAYSRTFLRQDDPMVASPVNRGEYYPANFDKPHAFNFTGSYHITHRYSVALNMTYSTGRPITAPVAKYYYAGSERVFYTDRNAVRIPDYFRTDISVTFDGNHKINQRFHSSVTAGLYNATGRANPYSTFFVQEAGRVNGYQMSIFATVLPFINYNVRF